VELSVSIYRMGQSFMFSILSDMKVIKYRKEHFKRCITDGDKDLRSDDNSKGVFCTKYRLAEFVHHIEQLSNKDHRI
jgi:hypothetical protein